MPRCAKSRCSLAGGTRGGSVSGCDGHSNPQQGTDRATVAGLHACA